MPDLPPMPGLVVPGGDATAAIDVTNMELDPDMATINLSLDQLSLGLQADAGSGVGGSEARTEALRIEDVNAALRGINKVVVGDGKSEAHHRTTAAMHKIERSPDQVQIHGTGSHPIYQPNAGGGGNRVGMIIGIVVVLLVIAGGIGAVIAFSGGEKNDASEATTNEPPPPETKEGPGDLTEACGLTMDEAWVATNALNLDAFFPVTLPGEKIPGEAVVIANDGAGLYFNGVKLDSADDLSNALAGVADESASVLLIPTESLAFKQLHASLKAAHASKRALYLGGQIDGNALFGIPFSPNNWGGEPAESSSVHLTINKDALTLVTPNPDYKEPPPAPTPEEKKDGEDGGAPDGKPSGEKPPEGETAPDGVEAPPPPKPLPKTLTSKIPHPSDEDAAGQSALAIALKNAHNIHSADTLRVTIDGDVNVDALMRVLLSARAQKGEVVFKTLSVDPLK